METTFYNTRINLPTDMHIKFNKECSRKGQRKDAIHAAIQGLKEKMENSTEKDFKFELAIFMLNTKGESKIEKSYRLSMEDKALVEQFSGYFGICKNDIFRFSLDLLLNNTNKQ